tara:strand:+ start:1357 stop:1638 length:282 start_codon:yes stop_codon:yes gene_type:complete
MRPIYKNKSTSSEVNLASQTHHVPHVGLPQIEPVNSVARVKHAPIGAHALDIINVRVCLKTIEKTLQIAITEYIMIENHAHGTWIYIILTVSP